MCVVYVGKRRRWEEVGRGVVWTGGLLEKLLFEKASISTTIMVVSENVRGKVYEYGF